MPAPAPPETRGHDYLRPSELGQQLGVCGKTVVNMIHSGDLEALRTPGGHYRIHTKAAAAALARLAA